MKKLITKLGILLVLLCSNQLLAQTGFECRGSINSSAGANCDFMLTAAELLASTPAPGTAYEITINGVTELDTIVLGPEVLNQTLQFSVRDTSTDISCWGDILFEDGLIPLPECSVDTVQCTDDINPLALGFPIPDSIMMKANYSAIAISDKCYSVTGWDSCGSLILCFEDMDEGLTCDTSFCSVIYRTWTVTDPNISPNKPASSGCIDTIYIALPSKDSIMSPMDFLKPNNELSCGDLNFNNIQDRVEDIWPSGGNGTPDILEGRLSYVTHENSPEVLTGRTKPWIPLPSKTGNPIGLACDDCVLSDWKDHVIDGPCSRFVERTWKIRGWCTNQDLDTTFTQKIKIVDTVPPIITYCPTDVVLSVGAHDCVSSDPLPMPEAFDECDNHQYTKGVTFSVTSDKGTIIKNGSQYYLNLDLNQYAPDEHFAEALITWTIDDGCFNRSTCSYTARVEDNSPPQAICLSYTQASLSSDGYAKLFADKSFDNGSHDNCKAHVYFKVLRVSDEDVDNTKHGSSAVNGSSFSCDGVNGDDFPGATAYQVYFDDYVKFCCEDVGTDQRVILRVYDWLPPEYHTGPVPRSEHFEGGRLAGRFNDCWATVVIEDKIGNLTCPANLSLLCTDIVPPSEATASTSCGDLEADLLNEIPNINSCGVGTITRIYRTTFPNGSFQDCNQIITISDTDNNYFINDLDCRNRNRNDGVIWPCDVTLDCLGAMSDLSPEAIMSEPEIFDNIGECSNVFVGFDDLVLTQDNETCVKLIRTWTVIDWCGDIVTSNVPPGCGPIGQKPRWCYEQIIKVVDDEDPVLSIDMVMDCDSLVGCNAYTRLTASADDNCTGLADDRTSWSIYQDASLSLSPISGLGTVYEGFLPAGTHRIEFIGEDGCGNVGNNSKEFTVMECKKPVPICKVGIGTVIMPSNGEVTIWAIEVDGGTKDDCSDITFAIRRVGDPTFTSSIDLTCDDLGMMSTGSVDVEMQVTDADGNSDFCTTFIDLQDNSNACGNGAASITGTVASISGDQISNHAVQLLGEGNTMIEETSTAQDGSYALFAQDGAQAVRPIKNDDAINGVNTLDLIAIQRHFLGIQSLDSPYKVLASDATNDELVNVLDLLELQEVILGLRSEFSNNQSWRYVSAQEEMTMENAFRFEEPKDISAMSAEDMLSVDFVAVKIGDVNGTASSEGFTGSEVSSRTNLELRVQAEKVEYGTEMRIPVTSSNFNDVAGYQYTLSYDTEELEFVGIESGVLEIGSHNVMTNRTSEGLVSTNWYTTDAASYGEGEVLFTLVMRGESMASLSINSALTSAESYRGGSVGSVSLEVRTRSVDSEFALYQNSPNPFNERTLIGFDLPSSSETTLSVYNVQGKEVYREQFAGTKGYNERALSTSDINRSTGVLYYRIETEDYSATKKMVAF